MSQLRNKKCSQCYKTKPLNQFHEHKGRYRSECKKCYNRNRRKKYQENIEASRQYRREKYKEKRKDKSDYQKYYLENMKDLAPRRHKIITLLANGYIVREIADEMNISISAVYTSLCQGYKLYRTRTREEMIAKTVHAGIIEFEDA